MAEEAATRDARAFETAVVMRRIEAKLDALKDIPTRLASLETGVAEIRGQLKSMPTLLAIAGTMLAINAGILGLATWLAKLFK